MARKFWPSGAVGQRLRVADGAWMRVVGVCGDVVHDWFDSRNVPTLYRPLAQAPSDGLVFAIRTAADPLGAVADARTAVARVDPTQPIFDVMSMREVLSQKTISTYRARILDKLNAKTNAELMRFALRTGLTQ